VAVPVDEYQLTGYAKAGIHETMLSDRPRMRAYRTAIAANVRDKVVLDVGAGTGILSLWAARAGARHVVAIEYHEPLAAKIRETARRNGLATKITVLSGLVERAELPVHLAGQKVDVIVSEWIGYALLYEAMLDSVIAARDRWLAPDGLMLPGRARLHVVGAADPLNHKNKREFWEDIYGFDMTAYRPWTFREAAIAVSLPENILTTASTVADLDMRNVTVGELEFGAPIELAFERDGTVDVLTFFFDVSFEGGTVLTTAPEAPATHWQQTHFYLRTPFAGRAGDVMRGRVIWAKGQTRKREVALTVSLLRPGGKTSTDHFAIEF
jgi:protein arginine N-methyltransferase 1